MRWPGCGNLVVAACWAFSRLPRCPVRMVRGTPNWQQVRLASLDSSAQTRDAAKTQWQRWRASHAADAEKVVHTAHTVNNAADAARASSTVSASRTANTAAAPIAGRTPVANAS